jgi:DNA-binding MarR family transcriptional regulator
MPASSAASPAVGPASGDPIEWVGYIYEEQGFPDKEKFLAMASVLRMHQLVTTATAAALKPFDLNPNSYLMLATIQLSETGARLLSHLAARIMVHPTTVTMLTDRLEAQGLLVREPHPTDRRATYARITPAGSALMKEATRALAEIDFAMPGLTKKQTRALIDLLAPVRMALGDSNKVS